MCVYLYNVYIRLLIHIIPFEFHCEHPSEANIYKLFWHVSVNIYLMLSHFSPSALDQVCVHQDLTIVFLVRTIDWLFFLFSFHLFFSFLILVLPFSSLPHVPLSSINFKSLNKLGKHSSNEIHHPQTQNYVFSLFFP